MIMTISNGGALLIALSGPQVLDMYIRIDTTGGLLRDENRIGCDSDCHLVLIIIYTGLLLPALSWVFCLGAS